MWCFCLCFLVSTGCYSKFHVVFKHFQNLQNLILNILMERLHISCQTARISKAMIKFWSKFHIQILYYSFTTDDRFLLTSSQSLQVKQELPSSSDSRNISNSLSVYFFLDPELNNRGIKVEVKGDFKSYFLSPKINSKADRLYMKFSSTSNTCVHRCLYPLFQNQHPYFMLVHFFEECLNPKVWIKKMVNDLHYWLPS